MLRSPTLDQQNPAAVAECRGDPLTTTSVATVPWWRALYLSELKDLLGQMPSASGHSPGDGGDLGDWPKLRAVSTQGIDAALTPHGISGQQLSDLLVMDQDLIRDTVPQPEWVDDLAGFADAGDDYFDTDLDERVRDRELAVIGNVLLGAQRILQKSLGELESDSGERVPQSLMDALTSTIPLGKLSLVCSRAVVLAMHEFAGDGPPNFADTVARLSSVAGQQDFFGEYPVLARCVAEELRRWVTVQTEVADRLMADAARLRTAFGIDVQNAAAIEVSFGAGDTHNGGRTVGIFTVDGQRLVYKPRSAANDRVLTEILDLVRQDVDEVPRHVRYVDGGSHSWHEFVVDNRAEIADWDAAMRGLGILTAVLYVLQANDFHHENIMLVDGQPIAVDTETLFHTDRKVARANVDFNPVGQRRFMDSTHSVGVTPVRILANGVDGEPFTSDISAIGYTTGQTSLIRVPRMMNHGEDDAHIQEGNVQESEADEVIDTAAAAMLARPREFRRGAQEALEAMAGRLDELLAHLDAVGDLGATSRIVRRPTMVYSRVLTDSYHPEYLRSGLDRDLVLSKLLDGFWYRTERDGIVATEMAHLRNGDIPYFTHPVDEPLPGERTRIVDDVKERVCVRLRPEEREFELGVLDLAFAAVGSPPAQNLSVASGPARPETLRDVAEEIVRSLHRRTSWGPEGTATLASLSPLPTDEWVVTASGPDLYSGLAGQAIAVAHSASFVGIPEAGRLIGGLHRSVAEFAGLIREGRSAPEAVASAANVGAWGPLAGFGQIMALQARAGSPAAARQVDETLELMTSLVGLGDSPDLLSGLAGAIRFATSVSDLSTGGRGRGLMEAAAEELVKTSVRQETGIGWVDSQYGQPLCGFSHGSAGIAVSLMEAGLVLEREDFHHAGLEALRYDSSMFDSSHGNWPDLRYGSAAGESLRAWCHGTAGGVLARFLVLPHLAGEDLREAQEIVRIGGQALADTLEISSDAPVSASLCHGLLGNLVIGQRLVDAGLATTALVQAVRMVTDQLTDAVASRGLQLGGAPGAFTPDLMMGAAGTLWALVELSGRRPGSGFDPLTGGNPWLGIDVRD